MEDGIVVGVRVEAGVIAERPLAAALAGLDVAFEDDLRVGRHFHVDRDALHELDAVAAKEPGEHQLVEPFGHRRRGGIRERGIRTERDRDRQPPVQPLGDAVMLRAALVPLPVHAGRARVEHLHPVRADVAHARLGILGEHERQRDVAATVLGPAFQDRQLVQ